MSGPVEAAIVGKWTVGYKHDRDFHILKFDFIDRQPIVLALPPEHAQGIANALLEQLRNPPPKRDRLS